MKTKRVAVFSIGAAVALGLGVTHGAAGKRQPLPAISLVSVRVDNSDLDSQGGSSLTELRFLLPPRSQRLLAVDTEASRVAAFVDDRGTNLAMAQGALFSLDRMNGRDFLRIASCKSPRTGAKEIALVAKVTVITAASEKNIRKHLDLKPGAELSEESLDIRVTQVQDVSFGDVKTVFVVQSERRAGSRKLSITDKRVGSIKFLDSEGKPIESDQMSHRTDASLDNTVTEITYGLHKRAASVTVETKIVDRIEPVVCDIDIRTGVGI